MNSDTNTKTKDQSGFSPKPMHIAMMACCAVMLLPVAGYFLAGGGLSGLGGNLFVFAPLLLCLGAHFFMHKVMGKSCHGNDEQNETEEASEAVQDVTSTVPQMRRG